MDGQFTPARGDQATGFSIKDAWDGGKCALQRSIFAREQKCLINHSG